MFNKSFRRITKWYGYFRSYGFQGFENKTYASNHNKSFSDLEKKLERVKVLCISLLAFKTYLYSFLRIDEKLSNFSFLFGQLREKTQIVW